jgi:hypothetical protein
MLFLPGRLRAEAGMVVENRRPTSSGHGHCAAGIARWEMGSASGGGLGRFCLFLLVLPVLAEDFAGDTHVFRGLMGELVIAIATTKGRLACESHAGFEVVEDQDVAGKKC